jgi:hypothetical protein
VNKEKGSEKEKLFAVKLCFAAVFLFRTCIHNRGMLDGRGFFSPDKEIF